MGEDVDDVGLVPPDDLWVPRTSSAGLTCSFGASSGRA